jgi:sulfur carrier protein
MLPPPETAPKDLTIQLNGKPVLVENMKDPSFLVAVISALELKADRIAVEYNGEIVRRAAWAEVSVHNGDRLEIVHFVGGGLD